MVQEWSSKNKKKRQRQINTIKSRKDFSFPTSNPSWIEESARELPWNQEINKKKIHNRLLWQTLASSILLVVTYFSFHSHVSSMKPVENFMYEAMTREFNFAGCKELYNRYVGNTPSILPTFSRVSKDSHAWRVPVQGSVVYGYDEKRKGIVIETDSSAKISSSADGWVVFAGYKEGLGNTIVIRHADNQETWYGWLNRLDVKEKDWIKAGFPLGDVRLTKGKPYLFFALKKKGEFINPVGVIFPNE